MPFYTAIRAGSDGVIIPASATPSDTGGRFTSLLPVTIGSRCAQLADLYNEWKINTLRVTYRPGQQYVTASTINPVSGGAGTFQLAGGFLLDPTVGDLAQTEIVEAGGSYTSVSKTRTWTLKNTPWLYCVVTGGSSADFRFCSPGNFYLKTFAVSVGDGTSEFGYLEFDWDISFRYALDSNANPLARFQHDPLADARRISQIHTTNKLKLATKIKEDEKQQSQQQSQIIPKTQPNPSGWFSKSL